MIAIFGSSAVGLSGAGPLGCLTTATVAAYKWRQQRQQGEPVSITVILLSTDVPPLRYFRHFNKFALELQSNHNIFI